MGINLTNKAIQDTYEGLVQISGSQLTDGTGSLIPSLDVSASFATSASHATFAETAGGAVDVNALYTASVSDATISFLKGGGGTFPITINNVDNAVSASYAVSASQATTASFAENSTPNTLAEVLTAGNTTLGGQSIIISGSGVITRTFDGGGITSGIAGGEYKIQAGSVDARLVLTGNGANTNLLKLDTNGIQMSGSVGVLGDLDLVGGVDIVGNLDLGGTGNSISGMLGSAIVVGSNQTISGGGDGGIYSGRGNTISAGLFGATLGGDGNTNSHNRSVVIGGAGLSTTKDDEVVVPSLVANSITASFASFQSASIGYLQSITGSAKIIGDAFIILNNNTPTERYAGLVVQDSGSTNNTASFEFDGQTNDWFYEYTDDGGATTEHGVALFGAEYNTKGSPSYPATNVLQKGNGGHHLLDSSITDDGTLVSIDANVSASGYVSASSFIGDGSQLTGISTSPFPFTGSADISGSIDLHGYITTGFANNVISSPLASHAIIGGQASEVSGGSNGNVIINGFSATISGGGVNTIVGANSTISSTSIYNGVYSNQAGSITGGSKNVRIGGTYGTISAGNGKAMVGGDSHTMSGGGNNGFIGGGSNNSITNESHNAIIAGTSNNNSQLRAVILGGESNTINGGQGGVVVGGINNVVGHNYSVVLGGVGLSTTKANEVVVPSLVATELTASGLIYPTADGSNGDVLTTDGSGNLTLQPAGGGATEWQAATAPSSSVSALNNVPGDIVVGAPHSIVYSSGSAIAGGDGWSSVIGGRNNQITAGASGRNTLIGGQSNTISGNYLNGIFAGDSHTISSGRAVIIGGQSNSIAGSGGDFSAIIGGVGNAISGGSFGRSVIVGGENNTINGHLKSVIIGGDGLSTTKSSEVVVPSLTTNGAVVQNVEAITITSNTGSLDASTGNLFTMTLQNGVDTHLELSNQSAGQTFQLKLTNNATSAGTITFDNQFDFEGGTPFTATATTNAVDILTFTTFDGGNVQCVSAKNFS